MPRRYRTEIVIPADRYVSLQLPDDLPEGRAIVTIWVDGPEPDGEADEPDRDDIEWWDEFDDD